LTDFSTATEGGNSLLLDGMRAYMNVMLDLLLHIGALLYGLSVTICITQYPLGETGAVAE
jgi:hypothetical protein